MQRVIAEIAERRFGGFQKMFEQHGWPERGADMMRKVQTLRDGDIWQRPGV